MTKTKIVAVIGFLLVVALAFGAGWYISGRDIRTFKDGLSGRFRDRGTVVFNTLNKENCRHSPPAGRARMPGLQRHLKVTAPSISAP
jgi:hypothetical protein